MKPFIAPPAPAARHTEPPRPACEGQRDGNLTGDDVSAALLPDSFRYNEDPETGCWLWSAYCDKNGYARIYDRAGKRIVWAHRFSYEFHKGVIPIKHEVDHVCQHTNCVNPDHLDAVTKVEHARRTMQRLGKDEKQLAAARLRCIGLTYSEIAEVLLVSRSAAHDAVMAAIRKGLIDADELPEVAHLTEIECEEMCDLRTLGVPVGVIAEFYGVHNSQASRVTRGFTSGHTTTHKQRNAIRRKAGRVAASLATGAVAGARRR